MAGIAPVVAGLVLTGCHGTSTPDRSTSTTSTSVPGPAPTTASTATRATTGSSAGTASPTVSPPRRSTSARYDVTSLLGEDPYAFPLGRPGPHGGVRLNLLYENAIARVDGATGPVSFYLCCAGSASARVVLDYQLGTTKPTRPTQLPIGAHQGVVLDGRLIAIEDIMAVTGQPRVSADVIVFPGSAATGLPVIR